MNALNRRRYIGNNRLLPSQYTQLEYIENTSKAYIIPNINGEADIDIDAQANAIKNGSQVIISSNPKNAGAVWYGESMSTQHWGVANSTCMVPPTTRAKASLKFTKTGIAGNINTKDGTYFISSPKSEISPHTNWTIFTPESYTFIGKLFSLDIYQNETIVRSFIPCINPEGIIGIYDVITKSFYSSANNDTFLPGPVV